ncbi:MAG: SUF system Fe-S cluster assembly protein [Inquilinus sp.]|nr:SUF system Fe-S cluster assembly protein [Inquilinus sp.]
MTSTTFDLIKLATGARPDLEHGSGPEELRARIVEALRTVHDPEIPVNIYELGLIYRLDIEADGRVAIDMTLTAPNCPVADLIPVQVMEAVQDVEGVVSADVNLVWEPPWDDSRMSEEARLALGMF